MKTTKIKLNTLFYISYILFLIATIFSEVTFMSNIISYINYLAISLLVIYIIITFIKDKINIYTVIKLALFSVIVLIVTYISKTNSVLKLLLLLLAFKDINFDDFIKKDFKYRLTFVIIVIILSYLGLTGNKVFLRDGETLRYSFGFSHPNILGLQTLSLCCDYIYIHCKDNGKFEFLLLLLVLFFNIIVTDSRATIACLIFIVIYLLFKKIWKNIYNNSIIKKFIPYSFLIMVLISLFIVIKYNSYSNNLINKLDELLSSRLHIANFYYRNYSITLFGNNLIRTKMYIDGIRNINFLPLDNAYIHLLLESGIIIATFFAYCYYIAIKKAYESKNYTLITILLMWILYSLMENNGLIIPYNPFLLYFSIIFYKDKYLERADLR